MNRGYRPNGLFNKKACKLGIKRDGMTLALSIRDEKLGTRNDAPLNGVGAKHDTRGKFLS